MAQIFYCEGCCTKLILKGGNIWSPEDYIMCDTCFDKKQYSDRKEDWSKRCNLRCMSGEKCMECKVDTLFQFVKSKYAKMTDCACLDTYNYLCACRPFANALNFTDDALIHKLNLLETERQTLYQNCIISKEHELQKIGFLIIKLSFEISMREKQNQ